MGRFSSKDCLHRHSYINSWHDPVQKSSVSGLFFSILIFIMNYPLTKFSHFPVLTPVANRERGVSGWGEGEWGVSSPWQQSRFHKASVSFLSSPPPLFRLSSSVSVPLQSSPDSEVDNRGASVAHSCSERVSSHCGECDSVQMSLSI